MASSILHKLLKDKKIPIKFISSLQKPKDPFLIPLLSHNLLLRQPHPEQSLSPNHFNPNSIQFRTPDSISPNSTPIFPSFPFGYYLKPILPTGSNPDCGDDEEIMWADSVKKKRKKKMNKHKLKKLRKRLRRKT